VEPQVRVRLNLVEAPLFEPDVLGVVKIVHSDDFVTISEQEFGYPMTDEASRACKQDPHT
jgi:hypothetical protein